MSQAMAAALEIAVVSMPGATERRERIAQWMARSPYPWRFFDGRRTPEPGHPQYDRARAVAIHGCELHPGEIGCFASHYALLSQHAAAGSSRWLLVIEDDVLIDFGFPFETFLAVAESAGLNYLKLYSRYAAPCRRMGEIAGRNIVRFHGWVGWPLGTQGYLISQAGARAFTGSVTALIRPIDWQLDRYWENGLTSYMVFPHPLMELVQATTITRARRRRPPRSAPGWLRYYAVRILDRARRTLYDRRQGPRDRAVKRAIEAMKGAPPAPAEPTRQAAAE